MRAVKGISILLLVFFVSNCTYQLEDKTIPNNLIPEDTFTMILYDVMVVESYYKVKSSGKQSVYKNLPASIDTIFQKYEIDSLRYTQSMDYYSSHQDELLKIYQSIQDSLILNTAKYENN